jgi:nitrogen fixation/metabolism regulation signal transduction histidine kinase
MGFPRRKKHFIDSNVQGALTRRIIFHWLVFMLVTSVVAFFLQVLSNPFQPLATHLQNLWWSQGPFLLVMVFLLPVFVLDTIKLSHRFAGPIFSLRRTIRDVAQGKPARKLKFRSRDFWQDLADDYNTMLSRFGALDETKSETAEEDVKLVESK